MLFDTGTSDNQSFSGCPSRTNHHPFSGKSTGETASRPAAQARTAWATRASLDHESSTTPESLTLQPSVTTRCQFSGSGPSQDSTQRHQGLLLLTMGCCAKAQNGGRRSFWIFPGPPVVGLLTTLVNSPDSSRVPSNFRAMCGGLRIDSILHLTGFTRTVHKLRSRQPTD